MKELIKPIINVTNVSQVCMVVHNVERTADAMWQNFGIGPWTTYDRNPDNIFDMTYHGKPARFSFRVGRPEKLLGSMEIELIAPLEGDSIYRDFLKEHGEGVQHLGWHVVENQEEFNKATQALEKAGFPCLMSGRTSVRSFAYFDTTRVMKTILEMICGTHPFRDQLGHH